MKVSTRAALFAVTGNAIVMGAVGVTAPIGWLLVPGVAGMASRPRVAALMSGWAGALILLSVAVPIVPGHRGDRGALATSALYLAVIPVLSWRRRRTRLSWSRAAVPTVVDVGTGRVDRPVMLAVSRVPGELATAVFVPGDGLWVLIGMVMGDVPDLGRCVRTVERTFRSAVRRGGAGLWQLPALLTPLVRRHAPDGYAAATFVRVDLAGAVQVLRCGGPEILGLRHTADAPDGLLDVLDAGPGALPLGAVLEPVLVPRLPDDARIAIVTTGYAVAHYDNYADAVHHTLRCADTAVAAARLLDSPTSAAGASVSRNPPGPAVVIDRVGGMH
ncbi:hypothetical protein GCM10009827_114780 [Dactylosporangium maewongense]|uniref:PPM-type phosphatase domain-containing protein n=1 Tax=Dactylosporangium maewongense TaxID=634393 RepID=A0ABP4P514_9ACTN